MTASTSPDHPASPATLSLGLDLVQIARVEESLARFGDRYAARVYTTAEIAYCETSPSERARRFAARFAAKEAAWKALALDDKGHDWRAIEVVRHPGGSCSITLHEPLASRAREAGVQPISLSLSHEADYAAAVVLAARTGTV